MTPGQPVDTQVLNKVPTPAANSFTGRWIANDGRLCAPPSAIFFHALLSVEVDGWLSTEQYHESE